ncbi:MAG: YDG domain-containing protein, partial [Mycobacterium sp.]|nr:YDG domain-containing protein [Mycobacterium sp.]
PGDNMSGSALSLALGDNDVIITNAPGVGNGDIFVEDAVTWGTTNTLSLRASRDVIISGDITTTNGSLDVSFGRDVIVDAAISATNGNVSICCGRDLDVTARAAITTLNGSILLAAGRDATVDGALSATDGNIMICAARDLSIGAAITVTDGSDIPAQSLGLPRGLVLSAGYGATSPGEGGTLTFEPTAPTTAVTNAPAAIYFNPVSYVPPFDHEPQFSLTEGAVLTQYMLVFPEVASKTFDGTTTATLTGLKGLPPGVTLVAGSGANAQFSSATPGVDKTVIFSGYTLDVADPNTANYAFAVPNCCGPVELRTSGDITAVDTPLPPPRPPRPRPPAPAPAPLPPVSQPVVPASGGTDRVVGNWNLPVIPVAQETPYRLTVAPLAPVGPVLLALESPAPVPVAPAPIVVPVEVAPPVLVAPPAPRRVVPVRPPKQDRN